jgi:anaerobic dimethyl sulfoxide reductase subunit B (iron-sulfur subunit)
MGRFGFYFNGNRCIGCRACQIACKDKNNLDVGVLFRQVRSYETGAYPNPGYFHHSSTCNHCERPACVASCPSEALYIAGNKTVQNDYEICIGCKNCLRACPYDVPQYLDAQEISIKCNMCVDLTVLGEFPVCVNACPQRVLEWGDLDELRVRHPDAVVDLPILPDSSQTSPSTIITPRACALEADFRQKYV